MAGYECDHVRDIAGRTFFSEVVYEGLDVVAVVGQAGAGEVYVVHVEDDLGGELGYARVREFGVRDAEVERVVGPTDVPVEQIPSSEESETQFAVDDERETEE